jgi:hypothetical protein
MMITQNKASVIIHLALVSIVFSIYGIIEKPSLFSSAMATDLPEKAVGTNAPSWITNSTLVAVRGIIWNKKIMIHKPLEITLVIKNVSKGEIYALRKYNSNNYMIKTEDGLLAIHGDDEGADFYRDWVLLRPGEITTFTRVFYLQKPVQGQFSVNFYNNMRREPKEAPEYNGIPVVNHLMYYFGTITVLDSGKDAEAINGHSPTPATNRTSSPGPSQY